jgi:protein TonB
MPRRALQDGTQGVVKAQIVLKGGAVQEVTILAGPKVFHAAVKAAIMQYKCVADGAGTPVTVTQDFIFKVN